MSEKRFSKKHEWVSIEGDTATVGITKHATEMLGDIVFVEVETEGEELDAEEVFGTIEAVKTVSDLFMPVDGEIVEVNSSLEDQPENVNNDPYGEGWMVKIKLENPSQVSDLLDLASYEKITN